MQTFLPYADFAATAAALDDRRLGKQRVETFQILRALVWPRYGWKRHPAVAMWRGFTPALVAYGLAVCAEWARRGHRDTVAGALLEFTAGAVPDPPALAAAGLLPPWLGDEAVHRSHRAVLARKDPLAYPAISDPGPGPDRAEYVWPQPLFPQWPLRRPSPAPLSLAAALALLGLPEPPEPLDAATWRDPRSPLLAALLAPAPALWLVPHPVPSQSPLPAMPVAARASTTARPAGPHERAAMAEEAAARPWVHVGACPQPPGLVVSANGAGWSRRAVESLSSNAERCPRDAASRGGLPSRAAGSRAG